MRALAVGLVLVMAASTGGASAAQARQGVAVAAPASLVLVKIFGCTGGPA